MPIVPSTPPARVPGADGLEGAGRSDTPAAAKAARREAARAPAGPGRPERKEAARRTSPSRGSPAPKIDWKPKAGAPAPAGYAASSAAGGEWAFLSDRSLSIEDKLFLFMKKVMEKGDKDLVDKMKAFEKVKGGSGSSGAGAPKASSLFDVVKSIVPPLGMAEKIFGQEAMKKGATQLGGPVLAAAATAIGLPQLAPLALKFGGDLVGLAFKPIGGGSGSAASASAGSGSGGIGNETLAMLEIQRLVEKQQQMFAMISNTMKAMHDMSMIAVQNLR